MSTATLLWIAARSLGLNCLAAMGARALAEFSPAELEEICRKWNKPDRLGHILHWREQVSLAMQSLRTLALAAAAASGGVALEQYSRPLDLTAGHGPPPCWAEGCCCWPPISGCRGPSPGSGPIPSCSSPGRCCGARASCWCPLPCWRTSSTWPCTAWPAATWPFPTKNRSRKTSAPSSPKVIARACWKKKPGK